MSHYKALYKSTITYLLSLWPLCVADADTVFLPCGFFYILLLLFYFLANLSRRRFDVYHTSTHGVALVQI